jgi:hypothetical protein
LGERGDRFWDSWMERSDRTLGLGMGKAIALFVISGKKGDRTFSNFT